MKIERSGFSSVKSISNTYRIKKDRTKSDDRSEKKWVTKFADLKLKMADFDIFASLRGKSVSNLTETIKNEIPMSDLPKKLSFAPYFSLHDDLPSTDGMGTPLNLASSTFFHPWK
ncbi:MAG: hypothetical protein GY821_05755 [Gammaproteobacteria bacterium]|nr:hypothetical protein [Gammaproteobacteria bacterium]